MVVVQAEGCAPIVRAFTAGEEFASRWENAVTVAAGLRVPQAIGDFLILRALRESRGTAVAVSERELVEGARELAPPRGNPCLSEGGPLWLSSRSSSSKDGFPPKNGSSCSASETASNIRKPKEQRRLRENSTW